MSINDNIELLIKELNENYCTNDIKFYVQNTKKPKIHCIFLYKNNEIIKKANFKNQKELLNFATLYTNLIKLLLGGKK